MASMTHYAASLTGDMTSKPRASDLLRSSTNGVCGIPLKALGREQLRAKRRDFSISAKIGKGKKHEYPWPKDPDPNVKGGVLSHLSYFKPLKEKPKPVTLDFEKPLVDLQKKISEVHKTANVTGLDFTEQIISLEHKYQKALEDLYKNLTPYQRLQLARHPNRPTCLDHIFNITEKFVELHGDRAGYNDPAIVTGLGTINDRTYMFIGHQKGRNTKENIQRNFGMPTPHGYRKALRMMEYADHHGFPIVTFVDTPGAYADLESEKKNQGGAIATNLRAMFGLKVPILSIVIGEGGSGGALAIACANKMLMLENAVFYVASPEACAAILWKDSKAAPKAAEKLKITATELTKLKICDGIIPEPLGGAHADPHWTSQQIKIAIVETMDELSKMSVGPLLKHRAQKYRHIGVYQEGIPIDPFKKRNMKKADMPTERYPDLWLREYVDLMKQMVAETWDHPSLLPVTRCRETIKRLNGHLQFEYNEAAKALGMEEKISILQDEVAKSRCANEQDADPALKEKLRQVQDEFKQKLPTAANYVHILNLLDMRRDVSRTKTNLEMKRKFKEIMDRPDIKQKIDALQAEMTSFGVTDINANPELKEKALQLKSEVHSEQRAALETMGLQVLPPELAAKVQSFEKEVEMLTVKAFSSPDVVNKIKLLKAELAKAGNRRNSESVERIQVLKAEVQRAIVEAVWSPELQEKRDKLKAEIAGTGAEDSEASGNEQPKLQDSVGSRSGVGQSSEASGNGQPKLQDSEKYVDVETN